MDKNFNIDFIGVGFSRCGTTWIAKCLQEHPEICTPEWKETHFFDFDYNYNKGLDFYKSFFKDCEGKVTGEYCPEYIYEEKALQRIKKHFPNAKIIVSVRNPTDRAFSHFLYGKRKNKYANEFSELFKTDPREVIDRSKYAEYITTAYKYFAPKNVLIVVHDDYKNNPKEFIQNMYKFLEVDGEFIPPSLLIEMNKSKDLRYKFNWFEQLFTDRMRKKKRLFWRIIIGVLKFFKISSLLIFLRGENKNTNSSNEDEFISNNDRNRLRKIYKNDIESLEKILKRDLSVWKN